MTQTSRTLACIYKPLGWIPVIVINGIAIWSYFAYVVILCLDTVHNPTERVFYLALYHPFFILFMTSYWKAIMSLPGSPPKMFFLTSEDEDAYENGENPQEVLDELGKNLPILTRSVTMGTRFCDSCRAIKPDRSHHCSVCGRCILKMDHHCPWINNCVGWGNYKYFVLFLFYSVMYTMYIAATSLKYFLEFWTRHDQKMGSSLHVMFLFFVSAMFTISLWSLLGFHIFLLLRNRTTLESFRAPMFHHGPDKSGFDLGKMNNVKCVFGKNKLKWFLPMFTTHGNGYEFLMKSSSHNSHTTDVHVSFHENSASGEKDCLLHHEALPSSYLSDSDESDADEVMYERRKINTDPGNHGNHSNHGNQVRNLGNGAIVLDMSNGGGGGARDRELEEAIGLVDSDEESKKLIG